MILREYRKGSLCVEAACVMPLFMLGLLTLVSVILMSLVSLRLQASFLNEAAELAVSCADGHNAALSDIKDRIAEKLEDEDLRFIENGRDGIDMSGSFTDDPEYIELCLSCNLVPLTDHFGLITIPLEKRCLVHIWCGYENGYFPDGEYVYITEESEVYHCDRNCSHIRLTVIKTDADEVGHLRNEDGGRYRACSICRASLSDGELFITPEGDRFHNSITCSGLKRTVRAIRKDMTGDRRPCSRCGR